ncbi:MAG: hypothetical protein JWO63_1208 [Frankiales bacterium]|jgi:hypothetical protein|nr:hypothetical protein [Frankiales bacterium]
MYLQSEALAHERMREWHARAAHRQLANELASARRWQRLASYSARRARRSQLRLPECRAAFARSS